MNSKIIFTFLSLAIFGYSLYAYFRKNESAIVVQELLSSPKIELRKFEFVKIREDVVTSRLFGQSGVLLEEGKVQLRDSLRAVRFSNDERDEVTADAADIDLPNSQLGSETKQVKVKTAKIFGNIDAHSGNKKFETEEALYVGEGEIVKSDVVSRIQQNGQYLESEKGFVYTIADKSFQMFGKVQGMVFPSYWQKKNTKGQTP